MRAINVGETTTCLSQWTGQHHTIAMSSRRVIQDSDDEDNAENCPVQQVGSQIAVISPPPTRSVPSAGPSTGSTGRNPFYENDLPSHVL